MIEMSTLTIEGKTYEIVDEYARKNIGTGVKTPVKGVDYWTDADQESIVQQVVTALGTPVFGTVDTNNNIILSGTLTSGTYTIKYENAAGTLTTIGTLSTSSGGTSGGGDSGGGDTPAVTYTNQLPISTDVDGSIYNVNNTPGYKQGVRWSNSSNAESTVDENDYIVYLSGYIPVSAGDVVRLRNVEMINGDNGNACSITFFETRGTSKDYINNTQTDRLPSISPVWNDNVLVQFTAIYNGWIRLAASYMGPDSIVTVNEEIA